MRKKCPNAEFFLVRIFPYLDWIRRDTEYSVRMRENKDQKNSGYGQFLRSGRFDTCFFVQQKNRESHQDLRDFCVCVFILHQNLWEQLSWVVLANNWPGYFW